MKTITTWKQGHELDSRQEESYIKLDGSVKNGMSPKALLLSGLAGCTAIDIVDILGKMHVAFSGLEVTAETTQTDEHPKVFKEIMLTYSIRTEVAYIEKVKKAIDLSLEKYCGVAAMLRKNAPINYKLVIT